eukprot:12289143-Alexandrium_andersonii.AAC.1
MTAPPYPQSARPHPHLERQQGRTCHICQSQRRAQSPAQAKNKGAGDLAKGPRQPGQRGGMRCRPFKG